MPTKKGGSGIVEGLWAGTAFFAATKANSFTGFVVSFVVYAIALMVILALAAWLLKTVGLQMREKMTDIGALPCPPGQTSGVNEGGERVCRSATATYIYPSPSGPSA
jgi:hypothetical protein